MSGIRTIFAVIAVIIVILVGASIGLFLNSTHTNSTTSNNSSTSHSSASPSSSNTSSSSRTSTSPTDNISELRLLTLRTSGMMSIYGAGYVQATLKNLTGVENATILYFNNTAYVSYNSSAISSQQIVNAVDNYSETFSWPFSSATVISNQILTAPFEMNLKTPNSTLIQQIKSSLNIPVSGTKTPYNISISLENGSKLLQIDDTNITALSASQRATLIQALDFTAPCCPPFIAYPDCCRCQIPRALTGLAKYLIVDYNYNATQVRTSVYQWVLFIEQNYFINSKLTSMGYAPIMPFFGCDGGCCSQPVVNGGCLISNQFPVEYNDTI